MTRTDVMALSGPRTASTAPLRRKALGSWRGLVAGLAVVLALALAPGVALAASEPTSGYKQTPTVSKTTPSKAVEPSKEAEKPKEVAPTSEKATSLPFTGFDLRWDIGLGLLLIAAGVSIVVLQRRQRRDSQR